MTLASTRYANQIITFFFKDKSSTFDDPNLLRDSNVSTKLETTEE
jgi:hypothetical protein